MCYSTHHVIKSDKNSSKYSILVSIGASSKLDEIKILLQEIDDIMNIHIFVRPNFSNRGH